jgi:signal transduction histidine kinase/DNA-binding response OmpR family regulator
MISPVFCFIASSIILPEENLCKYTVYISVDFFRFSSVRRKTTDKIGFPYILKEEMKLFALIPFIAFLLNYSFIVTIWPSRSYRLGISFFIPHLIVVCGWQFINFLYWGLSWDPAVQLVLHRGTPMFWLFAMPSYMYFLYKLSGIKLDVLFYISIISSSIFAFINLNSSLIIGGKIEYWWGMGTILGSLYVPAVFFTVILPFLFIMWKISRIRNSTTNPSLILLSHKLGLLLTMTMVFIILADVILPTYFGLHSIPRFGSTIYVLHTVFVIHLTRKTELFTLDISKLSKEIFEGVHDSIFLLSSLGRIIRYNSAAESTFFLDQRTNDIIFGRDIFGEDYDFHNSYESFEFQHSIDNQIKYFKLTQKTVELSSNLAGKLVIVYDVSQYYQREEELISDKQIAETANRTKSEFLAHMSHEIRTPLSSIIGTNELLLQENLDEIQRSYVQQIHSDSSILLDLLDNILDISKIESGAFSLDIHPFSLRSEVSKLAVAIQDKVYAKAIFYEVLIDPAVPDALMGDSVRLRQILLNFLSNAVKFTRQGGVVLQISHIENGDTGCQLEISVKDTGIGIDESNLVKIFQKFVQADSSISRNFGGSGLGMAISYNLIQSMNGFVVVRSEKNIGTEFRITIPLEINTTGSQPKDLELTSKWIPDFSGKIILLAEDYEPIAKLIISHIQSTGAEIEWFTDGDQAFKNIDKKAYDLVLLDIRMPVMDGFQTARKIRNEAKNSSIPIIGMSAEALTQVQDRVIQSGMHDFLPKPVRKQELYRILNIYFGSQGSIREADPGDSHSEKTSLKGLNQPFHYKNMLKEYLEESSTQEILESFLATAQKSIDSLFELNKESTPDMDRIHRIYHSMKGAALNMEAEKLAHLCALSEEEAKNSRIPDRLYQIKDELERMRSLMRLIDSKNFIKLPFVKV